MNENTYDLNNVLNSHEFDMLEDSSNGFHWFAKDEWQLMESLEQKGLVKFGEQNGKDDWQWVQKSYIATPLGVALVKFVKTIAPNYPFANLRS